VIVVVEFTENPQAQAAYRSARLAAAAASWLEKKTPACSSTLDFEQRAESRTRPTPVRPLPPPRPAPPSPTPASLARQTRRIVNVVASTNASPFSSTTTSPPAAPHIESGYLHVIDRSQLILDIFAARQDPRRPLR